MSENKTQIEFKTPHHRLLDTLRPAIFNPITKISHST